MPYIQVTVPTWLTIGQTVDAQIGEMTVRVTRMSETLLRVEADEHPAEIGRILSSASQDGRITVCCLVRATWLHQRKA